MNRSHKLNVMNKLLKNSSKKNDLQEDAVPIGEVPLTLHIGGKTHQHSTVRQIIATTIVAWLSMVDGYASAYSSPAESTMIADLNITKFEYSWISSLLPVGASLGSLSGGPFVECLGRKIVLIATDVIFISAWLINYFSRNCWNMYVSRILNGYCVGLTSFTVPVYLAETLQPKIRGRLGLFPTAFGNFGILICFISGNLFEWRGLAATGVIVSLPFLMAVWVVPESPRWFFSKGKVKKAKASLQWFSGVDYDVKKELEQLQHVNNDNSKVVKCTKFHLKVFAIVLGLMFFQQFSGINAIIFYSTQIFEESGSLLDASICTAIVGIVNFISTFIAAVIIDKLGRKILMYTSSIIMASMLAILGIYFFLLKVKQIDLSLFTWLPLSCFILYVLGFSFGLGPIPWLMMGEILPAPIRGQAASISAAFNWSCTFIVTKTFPLIVDSIGAHYAFGFFCMIMLLSLLFLYFFVPETKKRTLEDIERMLAVN